MAVLIVPTMAFATTRTNGKVGQYHLVAKWSTDRRILTTVCSKMMDSLDETVHEESIRALKPMQLCKKCLGAMEAVEK